jgi:hypothetical protein
LFRRQNFKFLYISNEYKIEQKITTNIDIWNEIETKNGKIVLTGNNDKEVTVVKVLEVIPEEEKTKEIIKNQIEKSTNKKKGKK